MMMNRMMKKNNGFTLIEIVLVITITTMLVVLIFQALDKIRQNEARFDRKRDNEKEVYILSNALSGLFKSISSLQVFNNREMAYYFSGTPESAIFLARSPLVAPHGGIFFVQLQYDKKNAQLLYREKPLLSSGQEQGTFISFLELKDEPFYPLMEEVAGLQFEYYLWNSRNRQFEWKEEIDTFEKDPIPLSVSLSIDYGGKIYQMTFDKMIKDKHEEIPVQRMQ